MTGIFKVKPMKFIQSFISLVEAIGYVQTLIWLVVIFFGFWVVVSGIVPVLLRLGKGLAKRKIAIFANGDNLRSLRSLLLDSKVFKMKNIIDVTSRNDIGRAEDITVFVIFWDDWKEDINQVLAAKKDSTALIVYAPLEMGIIPKEQMQQISETRNATVTNFRGRLLNDIMISMITTSYN